MKRLFAALAAGLVFGFGLTLAQMTDPRKVLGFLDVAGHWDPSLALVMAGAVAATLIGFPLVLRHSAPWFDARFHLPLTSAIDAPLLVGAAIFGIGWGIAGYCPGPAIAGLGLGNPEAPWLLAGLFIGMLVAGRLNPWRRT